MRQTSSSREVSDRHAQVELQEALYIIADLENCEVQGILSSAGRRQLTAARNKAARLQSEELA